MPTPTSKGSAFGLRHSLRQRVQPFIDARNASRISLASSICALLPPERLPSMSHQDSIAQHFASPSYEFSFHLAGAPIARVVSTRERRSFRAFVSWPATGSQAAICAGHRQSTTVGACVRMPTASALATPAPSRCRGAVASPELLASPTVIPHVAAGCTGAVRNSPGPEERAAARGAAAPRAHAHGCGGERAARPHLCRGARWGGARLGDKGAVTSGLRRRQHKLLGVE